MALFRLSAPTMSGNPSAQGLFPKNLTIRFGAHRASIYGITSAAKVAPPTTAAKNQIRESYARDLRTRLTQPLIMDE